MGDLRVSIFSLKGSAYDGPAEQVVVPASDGELGILDGHAALITLLKTGLTRVTVDGEEKCFLTGEGYLEICNNEAALMVHNAVPVKDRETASALLRDEDPLRAATEQFHREVDTANA